VDASGTIWTTGSFDGTVDFDPGPGAFNLTGRLDAFVGKLAQGEVQGRVWHDLDGNGIQANHEPGLAGAVVEVWRSGSSGDVLVASQVTAADGSYRILGTGDGPGFFVRVRPPAGTSAGNVTRLTFTPQNQGSNPALDSDVDTLGRSATFSIDLL